MSGGHFKLGLFVIGATVLLILSLLLLGVLDRFRPSVTVETYSDESIQTLVVGASVRYRGVQIGRVSRIGFARATYPEIMDDEREFMGQTVLIEMQIDVQFLKRVHIEDLRERIPQSVEDGLRARLASSGLGGPTFIELAYMDPDLYPSVDLPWTPRNPYVPSAPSTVTALVDALSRMLTRLSDDTVIDDVISLLHGAGQLGEVINDFENSKAVPDMISSLKELAEAGQSVSAMLEDERLKHLVDEASSLLRSVRQMLEDEGPEGVRPLIRSLTSMADALERTGTALDGMVGQIDASGVIGDLEQLASELGPAGKDLGDLAARLDRLVQSNEAGIDDLIQSLRRATAQLQGLLEEAEENPSRLIFGDPPPNRTPGESR